MGICGFKQPKLQKNLIQNLKEFEPLDYSSPKGKNENTTIPNQSIHEDLEVLAQVTFYNSFNIINSSTNCQIAIKSPKDICCKINFKSCQSYKNLQFEKEKIQDKQYIIRRELEILKQMDHPNIIKFHEIYQDDMSFHIVMEYCQGGELLKRILESSQGLDEQLIKDIFQKLLSAINYMHSKKICHRDLKPQNILFLDNSAKAEPKIIDFGLSSEFDQTSYFKSKVGTLLYVAPEVLNGNYTEQCDIWSLGIILYILLSGKMPYLFNTRTQLHDNVKNGQVHYSKVWETIPSKARELVKGLLHKNTEKRWSIQKCLKNEWLMSNAQQQQCQEFQNVKMIFQNLYNNFYVESRFQKEIMRLVIDQCDQNQLEELLDAFRKVDKNCTGTISFETLKNLIKQLQLEASDQSIQKLFQSMHIEKKDITPKQQTIDYSEFIACALASKKQISKNKLFKLFKQFTGNKNYFDKADLVNFFSRKGRKISQDILVQMMQEVDLNKQGVVKFQQFLKIMEGQYIEYTANAQKGQTNSDTTATQPESFTDYAQGWKIPKAYPGQKKNY